MVRTKSYLHKTPTPNTTLYIYALKENQGIRSCIRRDLNRLRALEFAIDTFETSDAGLNSSVERADRSLTQRLDELDHLIISGGSAKAERVTNSKTSREQGRSS